MATQQTNLGKVHVFPSETLYNNNKTNVSANDLAFVVDNSSGIIAQSLGTNGYVKFANGLIIQWGCYTSGVRNVTITFPVAFSTCYEVIATLRTANSTGASGSQNCQYVSMITATSFQAGSYDSGNGCAGFTWVAVGKG